MTKDFTSFVQTDPLVIGDLVRTWVTRAPAHVAIVEDGEAWTYRQLEIVISETRAWLVSLGVRPGDRVMIVGDNCRAFVVAFLAAAELEAWPVLVSARLSAREVDAIHEHCGARRAIYTTGASPNALEHAKRHGATLDESRGFRQIGIGPLNESKNAQPECVEEEPADRVAGIIYTSGSTGTPKGVMLTHRNLLFIAAVSAGIRALTPSDRLYGILPMSHAVGLSVVLLGTLLSGATLYLTPRFDPMTARMAIDKDRLTVVLGVPSMFSQFLQYAKLRGLKTLTFPALRIISSSGAPLDLATKEATERLFGMPLHNGYGITECSPTIAQTRVESPRSDTSVGPLLPGVQAKFLGPDGMEVAEGEVGELHVRGPNVMKGYYRAPEATAAAIDAEGWFNARDLAKLKDGSLFIVGRTKDLIVHSGFNVYPAEVEAVLNSHPAIVHSAVVGRSIEGDEEVVAFVQLIPEAVLDQGELDHYAMQHLASYKRPSRFVVVSTMPTTPTGKIAKQELRAIAQSGRSGVVRGPLETSSDQRHTTA